ncbi:MAG: SprT-like domain-containing protein [Bacteroidetes bacterium]|nr:SprT-like domain-containing protein [Bacteroidota bacterium]
MQGEKVSEKARVIFEKYLPQPTVFAICELIYRHPLDFQITKPRKTKLGDFRFVGKNNRPQITVNGDLNPYSFFITTIHELAHFYAFLEHGRRIQAHGKEWKDCYRKMLQPFLQLDFLPKDIEAALVNSLVTVKASSCSDPTLYKVLRKYDASKMDDVLFLDELPIGAKFRLHKQVFLKGALRRKRYECVELNSQRKYLVAGIAQVEKME